MIDGRLRDTGMGWGPPFSRHSCQARVLTLHSFLVPEDAGRRRRVNDGGVTRAVPSVSSFSWLVSSSYPPHVGHLRSLSHRLTITSKPFNHQQWSQDGGDRRWPLEVIERRVIQSQPFTALSSRPSPFIHSGRRPGRGE